MYLLNGDRPVLYFDIPDRVIEVIDNRFLPYPLKDYLKTSDYTSPEKAKLSSEHMEVFRDFLANRTLNLSRDNAKAILTAGGFSQSTRTEERVGITLACNSLSMTDNFWTKDDGDNRSFAEVDLRTHHLKDAAYVVSISGISASVERDILTPDIGTQGMFAKTWYRDNESYLIKTDKTQENMNVRAEIAVSQMLDRLSDVRHVRYTEQKRDGKLLSLCKNLTDASRSIIAAQDLKDWCDHTGREFYSYVETNYTEDFARMCVMDYVLANTDRHLGNIFFYVDNATNEVTGMTPLLDHNQALIADIMKADVSGLAYAPTNTTMEEAARYGMSKCDIIFPADFFTTPDIISRQSGMHIWTPAIERAENLGIEIVSREEYDRIKENCSMEDRDWDDEDSTEDPA